jgi:hypothetical protein
MSDSREGAVSVPAAVARSVAVPAAVTVEVASRRFDMPFECPCCGAIPEAELAVPVTRVEGREVAVDSARYLEFPYCARCVSHVTRWEAAGVVSTALMLAGILASLALLFAARYALGAGTFFAAFGVASAQLAWGRRRARRSCSVACASPDLAVSYAGWSGATSSFAFRSPTYTARFAEHNLSSLVNVSEHLGRLLEGLRIARLAVPTPAATSISPELDVGGWIAKIESAPTRVARRHHLRTALALVREPSEQQRLLEAASRAELAPVLARLSRLRVGARRVVVEETMAAVRADNLPAELEQAELELLRAQLGHPL